MCPDYMVLQSTALQEIRHKIIINISYVLVLSYVGMLFGMSSQILLSCL